MDLFWSGLAQRATEHTRIERRSQSGVCEFLEQQGFGLIGKGEALIIQKSYSAC